MNVKSYLTLAHDIFINTQKKKKEEEKGYFIFYFIYVF